MAIIKTYKLKGRNSHPKEGLANQNNGHKTKAQKKQSGRDHAMHATKQSNAFAVPPSGSNIPYKKRSFVSSSETKRRKLSKYVIKSGE